MSNVVSFGFLSCRTHLCSTNCSACRLIPVHRRARLETKPVSFRFPVFFLRLIQVYQLSARTYAQSCPHVNCPGLAERQCLTFAHQGHRPENWYRAPTQGMVFSVRYALRRTVIFFNLLFAYNVLELHSWLSPNSVLVAEGTASFLAARMYVQSCPATTNQPTRTPSRTSPSASPPRPPPSSATLRNSTPVSRRQLWVSEQGSSRAATRTFSGPSAEWWSGVLWPRCFVCATRDLEVLRVAVFCCGDYLG